MNRFYEPWIADDSPYRAAHPIAEVVAKLRAGRPAVAKLGLFGSIGDIRHLTAETPLDHTPYSQSGWPLPSAYGIGHATDIPHRPDLGVDCNKIFPHWLAAAKAGELPWLKYLIWQAKRYDVRNKWIPVGADDHWDHMHVSSRTDADTMSIGTFDPLGGMTMADSPGEIAEHWRTLGILSLTDLIDDHVNKEPQVNQLARILRKIDSQGAANGAGITAIQQQISAVHARLDQLAGAELLLSDEQLERVLRKVLGMAPSA